jgi:ribosomal protein S18 acetylase RimI-like enzyme
VAWPGEATAVQLVPGLPVPGPTDRQLRDLLDHLRSRAVTRVLTTALDQSAAEPYAAAGFEVRSQLTLLRRDLTQPIPAASGTQRSHRRRWSELAAIDQAAFGTFWSLDVAAIERAVEATTARRVRTVGPDHPVGYAVSGAAGFYGYLQRLAVYPNQWGHGYATTLVLDSLGWMRRLGARHAVVNTGHDNHRALALYDRLGFTEMAEGLCILEARLS